MSLVKTLSSELENRMDCVQADYERLIESGANKDSLERIIKHSMEIGIIKDKLENIRIHEVLNNGDLYEVAATSGPGSTAGQLSGE